MHFSLFPIHARRVSPALLILCVLLGVASIAAQENPPWRSFTSAAGDFTVSVPKPMKSVADRDGWKIQRTQDGTQTYEVRRKILSSEELADRSPSERLDAVQAALIAEIDGQRAASRGVLIAENRLGREFRGLNDRTVRFGRIFTSGTCLYALLVDVPATAVEKEADSATFFNSFVPVGAGCPNPKWNVIGAMPPGAPAATKAPENDVADLTAPVIQKRVPPEFPRAAKSMRLSGNVNILFVIGENGSVIDAVVKDGPTVFRVAALEAVTQWRYTPASLKGKPVKVLAGVALKFSPTP